MIAFLIFRNSSDIKSGNIVIGTPWFDVNTTAFLSFCIPEFVLASRISISEEFKGDYDTKYQNYS
jgi:hypothetical protein